MHQRDDKIGVFGQLEMGCQGKKTVLIYLTNNSWKEGEEREGVWIGTEEAEWSERGRERGSMTWDRSIYTVNDCP